MLSDQDIIQEIEHRNLKISPFDPKCVQAASYDCHLGKDFLIPVKYHTVSIHLPPYYEELKTELLKLDPGEFVLGCLQESITLPNNIAAQINGKSTLGRLGLACHITAGFVDPGWNGILTLELLNVSKNVILLSSGQKIAQVSFYYLSSPSKQVYGDSKLGSKYNNATSVEGAKS